MRVVSVSKAGVIVQLIRISSYFDRVEAHQMIETEGYGVGVEFVDLTGNLGNNRPGYSFASWWFCEGSFCRVERRF